MTTSWYPAYPEAHPVRRYCEAINHAISWLSRIALWASAVLIITLSILTAGLVVVKMGWSWSSSITDELKWHLFGASFLLAGAYCLRTDGHVRVDIVHQYLPVRVRAAIDASGLLLFALPLCLIVSWYATKQTMVMFERGEGSNQGGIAWYWPIYACLPLGYALLGLQVLGQALLAIAVAVTGNSEHSAPANHQPSATLDAD